MKTIMKAFKFGELVNTYIGDMVDQMLALSKTSEDLEAFMKEYLHEHSDEIDNVYTVIKSPIFPTYAIVERGKKSFIENREEFFNDQEQISETIVKKRLQSEEDEILYRFSMEPVEDED